MSMVQPTGEIQDDWPRALIRWMGVGMPMLQYARGLW